MKNIINDNSLNFPREANKKTLILVGKIKLNIATEIFLNLLGAS